MLPPLVDLETTQNDPSRPGKAGSIPIRPGEEQFLIGGDIVLSIQGFPVTHSLGDVCAIQDVIGGFTSKTEIELIILRGGKTLTPLRRTNSYSNQSTGGGGVAESRRSAIADMITHIRNYDPYPCILGIPVMPALFSTSKFYIFISFMMIGARVMVEKWKDISQ